ncbi:hypothetical protein [uncultured Thiodictyon sp.]|uniref:hypothetical protein n=1 Tax=uncultured Thiodictyon sp. TaxID=1846217 RepID=UPI0025E98B06|nr:hypothetical protein [uncultured Thiodictyon sp.]
MINRTVLAFAVTLGLMTYAGSSHAWWSALLKAGSAVASSAEAITKAGRAAARSAEAFTPPAKHALSAAEHGYDVYSYFQDDQSTNEHPRDYQPYAPSAPYRLLSPIYTGSDSLKNAPRLDLRQRN